MTGIFNPVRPKRRYFIPAYYAKALHESNTEQLGSPVLVQAPARVARNF